MHRVLTRSTAATYIRIMVVNNMKNKNQKQVNKVSGFTLGEVAIVIAVLSILAFLGPINFFQSKKLAHDNMMHSTARTAVQRIMEQINREHYNYTLQEVMAKAADVRLPIKSLSSLGTGNDIEIINGLLLNRVNHKIVALETQNHGGGEHDTRTMDLYVTPSVKQLFNKDGREVIEFKLEYHYESNFKGLKETHSDRAIFTKSFVSEL